MRKFLLAYVRPVLKAIGVYALAYRLFFFVLNACKRSGIRRVLREQPTAAVLLYHRVALVESDPVLLCVPPETFEQHLQFLTKKYRILPLAELVTLVQSKGLHGDEAALTFDDGYRDNLTNALPLLEKYNVPATIFITTGSLGKEASFEWDLRYGGHDRAQFLSEDEIRQLARHPLITIGAHTRTHALLASLPASAQADEIVSSKETLERITGAPIHSFAYPFGGVYDFNDISKQAAVDAGFDIICTNTQELVTPASSAQAFPRMNIRAWPVDVLRKVLFTDRRKILSDLNHA